MSYLGLGPQTVAAITDVGVSFYHQTKVNRMQKRFQRNLDRDAANIDYMRNMIAHFKNTGNRLLVTHNAEPGRSNFDSALKKALSKDMNYRGNCAAEIFRPADAKDLFKNHIWATVTGGGYVVTPGMTRDIGPIWATGCKNAYSEFRSNFIKKVKSGRKFTTLVYSKDILASSELIYKFVAGGLLIIMMGVVLKLQLAK